MIRYALTCAEAHEFESWFASASAYDGLRGAGHVTCPVCGSSDVEKALMAPQVRPARKAAQKPANTSLSKPETAQEAALAELRRKVEENSDYVGGSFVSEARRMHDGEIPHRSIYGEARLDEAKKLLEDGVPVAPLPFTPRRKAN